MPAKKKTEIVDSDKQETKQTTKRTRVKKEASEKATDAPCEAVEQTEANDTSNETTSLRASPGVSGALFDYNGMRFVALDVVNGGVLAISAEMLSDRMRFHDNNEPGSNDWRKSTIRKKLNNDYISKFNSDDLIPIVSDLTADTGEDNYGACEDLIALPSDAILRKFNKVIPSYNTWIWSITPWAINYSTMSAVSARTQTKTIYSEQPNRELGVAIICIFKKDVVNL